MDLGTGNDESIIIGGDFRECWVGIRMQAMAGVSRELFAANYQYGFMMTMRADVQLAHAAAFCALTGITATSTVWLGESATPVMAASVDVTRSGINRLMG